MNTLFTTGHFFNNPKISTFQVWQPGLMEIAENLPLSSFFKVLEIPPKLRVNSFHFVCLVTSCNLFGQAKKPGRLFSSVYHS